MDPWNFWYIGTFGKFCPPLHNTGKNYREIGLACLLLLAFLLFLASLYSSSWCSHCLWAALLLLASLVLLAFLLLFSAMLLLPFLLLMVYLLLLASQPILAFLLLCCYRAIGISNIRQVNSRNYRTIGYRIKASINRTQKNSIGCQCSANWCLLHMNVGSLHTMSGRRFCWKHEHHFEAST